MNRCELINALTMYLSPEGAAMVARRVLNDSTAVRVRSAGGYTETGGVLYQLDSGSWVQVELPGVVTRVSGYNYEPDLSSLGTGDLVRVENTVFCYHHVQDVLTKDQFAKVRDRINDVVYVSKSLSEAGLTISDTTSLGLIISSMMESWWHGDC